MSSTGFDIKQEAAAAAVEDEGTLVHVEDRTGKPYFFTDAQGNEKPVTITVAGSNSRRYRRAEDAIRKRPLKPRKFNQEQIHEEAMEKAIACTVTWEGIYIDGTPVDPSRHNVGMLYKACPWVLNQVNAAIHDPELFTGSGSQQQ